MLLFILILLMMYVFMCYLIFPIFKNIHMKIGIRGYDVYEAWNNKAKIFYPECMGLYCYIFFIIGLYIC